MSYAAYAGVSSPLVKIISSVYPYSADSDGCAPLSGKCTGQRMRTWRPSVSKLEVAPPLPSRPISPKPFHIPTIASERDPIQDEHAKNMVEQVAQCYEQQDTYAAACLERQQPDKPNCLLVEDHRSSPRVVRRDM